mmetsp:Transcript_69451/g.194781  ORF Transcript_69451/g.194781 Transcript_69451/m.194781 type:complete len:352 (-) Transcript_69451:248-1303(-)
MDEVVVDALPLPLPLLELGVQGLVDLGAAGQEVPAHGDAHHRLTGRGGNRHLQLLFDVLRAERQRQAAALGGEVLVCQLLRVRLLKDSSVANAEADEKREAEDVGADREYRLRQHEPLLRLVAEGDHDAVLPRRLRAVQAEVEELPVVEGEDDPPHADGQRPDDDRDLEVELQPQPGPADVLLQQVRGQRPDRAIEVVVPRHVRLRVGAVLERVVERLLVDDGPPEEVHDPSGEDADEDEGHDADGNNDVPRLVHALAVAELVPLAADGARVRAVRRALPAALEHARPADAPLRVDDGLMGIRRPARLAARLDATEVAMHVVPGALREQRALRGTPLPLVAVRAHPHALPA